MKNIFDPDLHSITSSVVRKRILELTEGTEGLTREQAFVQAVIEQAAVIIPGAGE